MGGPYRPAALAVFTIRPKDCLRKIGHTALEHANELFRCTVWTASNSASDMFLKLSCRT
jgi:hypothetical protein